MTRLTFLFIVTLLAYPPEVKTLFPPRKTSLSRKIFNTELLKYYNKGSASPNIASWLICAQASAIKENDIDFLYAVLLLNTDRLICDGKASKALTFLQKQAKQIPPVNHQGQACADKALGDCFMSFKHTRAARNKYADIIKQIKADGKDYHLSATDFTLEAPGPSDKAAKYRLIANQYLNLLLILSNDSTSPAIVGKVQLSLFKVDSASRYYLGAFSHYRQYQSVRDTVFNSGKIKQISALQAQFEKSLQANRTNQSINKMQIVGSTQMSMTQNMLLVLFLLLTTCGLLYLSSNYKLYVRRALLIKQRDIQQKNILLEALLEDKDKLILEKNELLREVHHRVKNNLQTVISLLYIQSSYLNNKVALSAIQENLNRLQAMVIMHQKLYTTEDIELINMQVYVTDLIPFLEENLTNRVPEIGLLVFAEAILLNATQAVLVGLFIGEAVTNMLRGGFFGDNAGTIHIELVDTGKEFIELKISISSHLLPVLQPKDRQTEGVGLMKELCIQLKGTFRMDNDPDFAITLKFKRSNDDN